MTPTALLIAAQNAGLALKVEAGILRVRGPQSALATWAPRLKAHKPALIALLQPPLSQFNPAPATTSPICEAWAERAAILEFDGGLSRAEAEAQATCRRWLIQEPDDWRDCTHTPPASRAELRGWYPEALALVPCDDDADPWGGAEDPEGNEPGPQEEEDPGAAFYRDLFAGMEGPRAYATLTPEDTHRAVVDGLVRPEDTRGAVILAYRDPAGHCALLAIPSERWDPFEALSLLDGPGTVH